VVVKTASKTSGKACNPTTGQSNRVEAACTLLLSERGREEADQRDRNKPVAHPYYFGVQQRRAAAANCALKSGAAPCLAPAERGGLRKSAPLAKRSRPRSPAAINSFSSPISAGPSIISLLCASDDANRSIWVQSAATSPPLFAFLFGGPCGGWCKRNGGRIERAKATMLVSALRGSDLTEVGRKRYRPP
jgi:hypothetical protein